MYYYTVLNDVNDIIHACGRGGGILLTSSPAGNRLFSAISPYSPSACPAITATHTGISSPPSVRRSCGMVTVFTSAHYSARRPVTANDEHS